MPFLCSVRLSAPSPSSLRKGSIALKAGTRDNGPLGPTAFCPEAFWRPSVQLPANQRSAGFIGVFGQNASYWSELSSLRGAERPLGLTLAAILGPFGPICERIGQ